MCPVKHTAPPNVSSAPGVGVSVPPPARRMTPKAATPTAAHPAGPTRSEKNEAAATGVRITEVPVRNPEIPEAVLCNPMVCSRNPEPSIKPSPSPCRRSLGDSARTLAAVENGGGDPIGGGVDGAFVRRSLAGDCGAGTA
jgi:hypothetical protein